MTTKTVPTFISAYTGAEFNYLEPSVNIVDVAHGLGNACRFGNQASTFYSVAEHSCLVASIVALKDPGLVLPALWHDAHEAYVGDVPTPLKLLLGDKYREIVDRIDPVVAEYLGIDPELFHHPLVVEADHQAMEYEAAVLQPHGEYWAYTKELPHFEAQRAYGALQCLLPGPAERAFLNYNEVLGVYADR